MTKRAAASWPRRGQVYLLNFDPATGHEMGGLHPCAIVQNDIGNQHSSLTIVVAITSNLRVASLPIGVRVAAGDGGLHHESAVHCGHLYTIDKSRLGTLLGQFSHDIMAQIDAALSQSLAL